MINKELIDNNFNFAFKATTFKNVQIAVRAYEDFLNINEKFFKFEQRSLLSRILTYTVEKQFNDSSFTPKSNYSVERKRVNEYKQLATFIETGDFMMNVGKTIRRTQLLCAAKYKRDLARANKDFDTQYELDFRTNDKLECTLPKKYGTITYGYFDKRITHLDLVIPDSTYTQILYQENLLKNYAQYDNYIPKEVEEEDIVRIRESILSKLEKERKIE